jgi:tetratricopeptide (TPR) repeat protein
MPDRRAEIQAVLDAPEDGARARGDALLAGLGSTPEAADAAAALGAALADAGRREPAVHFLRAARERYRALARQPELLRAYGALGCWHRAWNEPDEAESALRTAIQQARTHGDDRELGLWLRELGRTLAPSRPDRALLAFVEAVACLRGRDEEACAGASEELRRLQQVPGGHR